MRGRHTKTCATAHERDRQLYRQIWFQANRDRIRQKRGSVSQRCPAKMDPESARQWLENRRAAHKLAHPPRPPYQKRLRACRASRKSNRQLTPEEKARLHELKRIRYSVDDDFRAKVNAYNRDFYQRHREKILAQHRQYNSRPEVLARRRERATTPEAHARHNAKHVHKSNLAARRAEWATTPMPTKAELKAMTPVARRRVRQLWKYRKRVAATTP